jgi:DNA-binding transcriptional LysR family regulator
MNNNSELSTPLHSQIAKIDLQHLRYAVAAAKHGSLRRAAEALLLRQSTLSRCIRQLETAIGMIVFDRTSGGVRATQAGRSFLQGAGSILEQMDALVVIASSIGRGEAGRLAIGFYTSLSARNLRATLIDFKRRCPQVELGLVERSRARLVTALRNGALDIAVIRGDAAPEENDTNALALWSERMLVALPESHSLADRKAIYWTDLRSETVLLSERDPGRDYENLLMSKLSPPHSGAKIQRYDVGRGGIESLVSVGFGISFVVESDVGANSSGVIYRELRDCTGPSRIGYSAHWRTENDNPALASFLKLLGERYPSSGI